jgi:hypothetical protein
VSRRRTTLPAATPAEVTVAHTRLMKCALEVEDARAYWRHAADAERSPQRAFEEYWFGAKSRARINVLFANFRARFDAYPEALAVLGQWTLMDPGTRQQIAHWHLQLSDPLYRQFTGDFLVDRRYRNRGDVSRDMVVDWVSDHGSQRWTMSSRIQIASKLLSAAYAAGLVDTNRDPRPLVTPRVRDEALAYLMYLLRDVVFEGTLLDNPYVASVGLDGGVLRDRLAALPGLRVRRQGDLLDFVWEYPSLAAWGDAMFGASTGAADGDTSVTESA